MSLAEASPLRGPPSEIVFNLTDHFGRSVSPLDYRGRHALVFFGFTHCRVVCPRALGRLSEILDSLGGQGESLKPLYITVDPERDTPGVMRTFLEARFPRFVGLTGSVDEIAAAKASFRVFAARAGDPEDPDGYAMPHSALTYLIDPQGRYQTHFPDGMETLEVRSRLASFLPPSAT